MFRFLKDFGRSPQWSEIRKNHLKSQPECQACGRNKDIEVHHIEPFHVNPLRELDPTNLITLCKSCHLTFGHLMDYKSWNKDVVSDSMSYRTKLKQRPYHENFNQKPPCINIFSNILNFFGWNN